MLFQPDRINGREGLRACCLEKAVVTDRFPFGKAVAIHPIREHTYPVVESAVRLLYSGSLGARIKAVASLVRGLAGISREARG